jgi:5-formyltetrahydrofolate cyclo-ligase
MDLAERKAALRRTMAQRRSGIAREAAARAGAEIAQRLASAPELARARRIALYTASDGEPALDALAAWAEARGVATLWPRIAGARLELAECAASALVRGRYGIAAPPDDRPSVALATGDLVLLPALALDAAGRRLGRGAGHYDRALAGVSGPLLVGVGYDWQLVGEVPDGPEDRRVDMVVTETKLLRTHAPGSRRS